MTYCKVSQVKPGLLRLEGDGFVLNMTYNPGTVSPSIEQIEVKDNSLKRFWPQGVTRIKLQFRNPGLKGNNTLTFIKAAS